MSVTITISDEFATSVKHRVTCDEPSADSLWDALDQIATLLTVLWRAQARSFRAKIASLLHPPHAGVRWFSTYFRMMSSGAAAQDAAKYEGDQRWSR